MFAKVEVSVGSHNLNCSFLLLLLLYLLNWWCPPQVLGDLSIILPWCNHPGWLGIKIKVPSSLAGDLSLVYPTLHTCNICCCMLEFLLSHIFMCRQYSYIKKIGISNANTSSWPFTNTSNERQLIPSWLLFFNFIFFSNVCTRANFFVIFSSPLSHFFFLHCPSIPYCPLFFFWL